MENNEITNSKYWYHYIYGELEFININGDIVKLKPSENNYFYKEYLKLRAKSQKSKDEYLYFNISLFKTSKVTKGYILSSDPIDIAEMFVSSKDTCFPLSVKWLESFDVNLPNSQYPLPLCSLYKEESIGYCELINRKLAPELQIKTLPLFINVIRMSELETNRVISLRLNLSKDNPFYCSQKDFETAIKYANSAGQINYFKDTTRFVLGELQKSMLITYDWNIISKQIDDYIKKNVQDDSFYNFDNVSNFICQLIKNGIIKKSSEKNIEDVLKCVLDCIDNNKDKPSKWTKDILIIDTRKLRINPQFYLNAGLSKPSYLELREKTAKEQGDAILLNKIHNLIHNLTELHKKITSLLS